ncbi:hypothetical protein DFQ28_002627, partial [Apophysomyces sp. BC1034]
AENILCALPTVGRILPRVLVENNAKRDITISRSIETSASKRLAVLQAGISIEESRRRVKSLLSASSARIG